MRAMLDETEEARVRFESELGLTRKKLDETEEARARFRRELDVTSKRLLDTDKGLKDTLANLDTKSSESNGRQETIIELNAELDRWRDANFELRQNLEAARDGNRTMLTKQMLELRRMNELRFTRLKELHESEVRQLIQIYEPRNPAG
jgi:chromosome segregation ATPase